MSCSALRFSNELNNIKYKINNKKSIKLVIANVVNDVEKYSVHMLEVVSALGLLNVKKITHLKVSIKPFILVLNQKKFNFKLFWPSLFIFNMQLYLLNKKLEINFQDNFSSFKNTLIEFKKLIKYKKISYSFNETRKIMKILINLNK